MKFQPERIRPGVLAAIGVFGAVLGGCTTAKVDVSESERAKLSGGRTLSPKERAEIRSQDEALEKITGNYTREEDPSTLFLTLQTNLSSWHNVAASKTAEDYRVAKSLKGIITRSVYWNFDEIMKTLKGPPSPNRIIAAGALGFSRTENTKEHPDRSPEAVPALLEVLAEGDDALTQNSLLSLGLIADPGCPKEPIIALLLRHHNPEVRSNAAYCLGRLIRSEDAGQWLHSLVAALGDSEPKVRLQTINALAHIRSPEAGYPLVRMLQDESPLVRANAARGLGELGTPSLGVYLLDSLESPFAVERVQAHEALCKLSGSDMGLSPDDWRAWCNERALPNEQKVEKDKLGDSGV